MFSERRTIVSLASFVALLFIIAGIRDTSFLSVSNLLDVTVNTSYIAIAALGMFVVILTGQIDVSVGAILAFTSTVAAALSKQQAPFLIILLAALATGVLLGLLNGTIVAMLRIHSIVATLGTLIIYRGFLILLTHGNWITGISGPLVLVGRGRFLGVPISALIMAGVFLIGAWLLKNTKTGRDLYAVGSNTESARLSGVSVVMNRLLPFAVNGLLLGLSGVLFAGRFGSIQSNIGQGFELVAIAAVVVGGANIFGGAGSVTGTFLGALLISVMGTLLVFYNVNAYWEDAVEGLIILLSVAYYMISRRLDLRKGIAVRGGTLGQEAKGKMK